MKYMNGVHPTKRGMRLSLGLVEKRCEPAAQASLVVPPSRIVEGSGLSKAVVRWRLNPQKRLNPHRSGGSRAYGLSRVANDAI